MPSPPTPGPASKTDALQDRSPLPAPPADIGEGLDVDDLSAEAIRAQIVARERDMKYHVAALRHEVLTMGDDVTVGGRPLLDLIRSNKVLSMGVAVGVGLLAGALLGARARARRRPEPDDGLQFIRARTATLLDEAAWKVALGLSTEEALRQTLKTTPVVYAEPQPVARVGSPVGDTVDIAIKSATGFLLKAAMDRVTQTLTGHEETFAAVADATSDS